MAAGTITGALRRTLALVVATAVALAAAGCEAVADEIPLGDLAGTGPTRTVGRVLEAIASGDLAAANSLACPNREGSGDLPVDIPIRFGLSVAPDIASADVLRMLEMDLSGLTATERVMDDETTAVHVTGPVVLAYDLERVRDAVTESAGAAAAETALAVLGDGTVTTTLDVEVWVTRIEDRWWLCEPGAGVE